MSNNQNRDRLVACNIATLGEGAALLDHLSADQFNQVAKPLFLSSIGAHYRHFLEHYQCFFEQLKTSNICYDSRCRDSKLEQDLPTARQVLRSMQQELSNLREVDRASLSISDDQTLTPADTTIERELLFLQSHTIHHFAIIAAIARSFGIAVPADFGVAIATLNHVATRIASAS